MIDVAAAVRGLPRLPVLIATSGPSDSTGGHDSGSDEQGLAPPSVNASNPQLSVQSANGSTFSANSEVLLLSAQRAGEPEPEQEKSVVERKVFGLKTWWIVIAFTSLSIILSIVLGVTLGIIVNRNHRYCFPRWLMGVFNLTVYIEALTGMGILVVRHHHQHSLPGCKLSSQGW